MINISETFVDNFKRDFMFNNIFPKIVSVNVVERDRTQQYDTSNAVYIRDK